MEMVRMVGFDPTASRSQAARSTRLSYILMKNAGKNAGWLARGRTEISRLMRPAL
jgi:hypothetical protein